MERRRVDYPTAGNMFSRRKLNGSMPAGQARPPHTRGAMISIRPVLIIIGTEDRLQVTILNKPAMWVNMRPTRGAFLTCREMSGSGSTTGRQNYLTGAQTDPEGRHRARVGSAGWFLVPTAGRACVLLSAAATPPVSRNNIGFRVGFQASPARYGESRTGIVRGETP